jgi:ribosomal-protein-alanine N-acetyltransferase
MLEIDFREQPEMLTARLRLRRLALTDSANMHTIRSDPAVMKHIGRPISTSEQDAIDLIQRIEADRLENKGMTWAIEPKESPGLIGTIGFYRLKPEHHMAEVGYALGSAHWGRGLMAEALEAVVGCAFERYRFHRVEAITDPANAASRRLLEKCGFQLEGLLRENYFWNGTFVGSAIYGRLAT